MAKNTGIFVGLVGYKKMDNLAKLEISIPNDMKICLTEIRTKIKWFCEKGVFFSLDFTITVSPPPPNWFI